MPTVHSVADSVTLADKRLLRAYPRIVKELTAAEDKMDRQELDGFLKLLPAAVERFEASNDLNANTIEPSVLSAIQTITASFGPRNSSGVNTDAVPGNSNTPDQAVETLAAVGGPDQPNGSDTDQSVAPISLSRNELAAPAGNGEEPDSPQASPRNSRVRTRSPLSGRGARMRSRWASGESADDQGRLSGPKGRVEGTGE